jgi:hypothetical protein
MSLCTHPDSEFIYLFGGANCDHGPMKDLFSIHKETKQINKIEVVETADCPLLCMEMHTGHMPSKQELVIIGGRCLEEGKGPEAITCSDLILKF